MKSNKIYELISLVILTVFLNACGSGSGNKDDDDTNVSITGLVRTIDSITIEGVEAYNSDGVLATSDENGSISFTVSADKVGSVRLRKSGYAAQTVVLEVNNNAAVFFATLGKRNAAITVNADANISITAKAGAMVSLDAGALVDTNGNTVSGSVQLSITPVNIADDKELGVFPGAFSGTDIEGNAAPIIMSYGTVEYYFSQNGNELNLAPNQTATIEIPIYVTGHSDGTPIKIGDAGALWYLNEDTGLWIQENIGTVVASLGSPTGMALRASVTHFSWWNHDVAPETCDLTITPSGLPNQSEIELNANNQGSSVGPGLRPRSASTTSMSEAKTVLMPRDIEVYISSSAIAADRYYSAQTFKTCSGEVSSMTLEFEGPDSPKIVSFTGVVKPIFILDIDPGNPGNTQWKLDSNDAVFTWITAGAESLIINSDKGHNTTVGNAYGSTQFPMKLNGESASQYTFTLNARNAEDLDSKSIFLNYDATPNPVINSFNYSAGLNADGSAQTAGISWDVEGADSIVISYSRGGDDPKTIIQQQLNIGNVDSTALNLTSSIFNVDGAGAYFIVAEFINQYGSTFRSFYLAVYDTSSDGGDGGGDDGGDGGGIPL